MVFSPGVSSVANPRSPRDYTRKEGDTRGKRRTPVPGLHTLEALLQIEAPTLRSHTARAQEPGQQAGGACGHGRGSGPRALCAQAGGVVPVPPPSPKAQGPGPARWAKLASGQHYCRGRGGQNGPCQQARNPPGPVPCGGSIPPESGSRQGVRPYAPPRAQEALAAEATAGHKRHMGQVRITEEAHRAAKVAAAVAGLTVSDWVSAWILSAEAVGTAPKADSGVPGVNPLPPEAKRFPEAGSADEARTAGARTEDASPGFESPADATTPAPFGMPIPDATEELKADGKATGMTQAVKEFLKPKPPKLSPFEARAAKRRAQAIGAQLNETGEYEEPVFDPDKED